MPGSYQDRGHGKIDLAPFKPILRAYALGYVTVTGPRLLALLLRAFKRKDVTAEEKVQSVSNSSISLKILVFRVSSALSSLVILFLYFRKSEASSNTIQLLNILRTSTQIKRFPTSCAIIVAGATFVPRVVISLLFNLRKVLRLHAKISVHNHYVRPIRIICTFLSALVAFNLLNEDDSWNRKRAQSRGLTAAPEVLDTPNQHHYPNSPPPHLAGKTIDLTLFAGTRALSVLVLTLWTRTQSSRHHPTHISPKLTHLVTHLADPAIFSASAALIMYAWLYSPSRLPHTYNHWIQKAANIDPRFLRVLRLAKTGDWTYGRDTGAPNQLLRGVAHDLHLPEAWGDPALTAPIKCELVHSGCGPSCEFHALWRFWRAWLLGMEMYLPLQLVLRLLRRPTLTSLLRSIAGAARSSAFLGSFVSLFYYAICLARTRLGPFLLPPHRPWGLSPQRWDGGLCVLAACGLCGWSILVETPARRAEVAFFVAPRALATLLPRVYERRVRWREGCVFAGSVAVVMDAVVGGNGKRVRGVLGRVLEGVVRG